MQGSVLDRGSILELIRSPEPLVSEFLNLEAQLQPNGFDLTLREVSQLTSGGGSGPLEGPANLSEHKNLKFQHGYVELCPGPYLVTVNEVVSLPNYLMALGRPRSSLLRCGVAVHTAVWDAGYRGRSQVLLSVYNPSGYRVAKDARLLQLVFLRLARPLEEGYTGRFLDENL